MAVALALVVAALFAGLFAMGRGGLEARRRSNKLMQLRVVLQAIAVFIILIAIFFARGS